MKKAVCFGLAIVFLLLAGCDTVLNAPPQINDISDEQSEVSMPAPMDKNEIPPAGDGVWHVETEEQLWQIDFAGYKGTPTVCITKEFAFTKNWVADRPITLYYTPQSAPQTEFGIYISTRGIGEIKINSSAPDIFEKGIVTIDAPFCDLFWIIEYNLNTAEIGKYCNVKSFNGKSITTLGGNGSALINSVSASGLETVCSIRGSVITVEYPISASDKEIEAAEIIFDTNGHAEDGKYTLTEQKEVTVTDNGGNTRTYLINPRRISYGLPTVQIYTNFSAPILSKNEYVGGVMYIDGEEHPMQIKGRGNASWNSFPKKSYRIKLEKGKSLFGLEKNRDWVLVGNYADKSLIRNAVAHDIAASMEGLDFTSTHISVNFYLNGEYKGVYTFADKIEEGAGRIDFTDIPDDEPNTHGGLDIGFLVEIGWDFDGENDYNKDYFDANLVKRIYIKEPKSDRANTPEFTYAKYYLLATENAIVTNNGWENYIDLESWVDWFIVTELTFNMESAYYRSCYLWKRDGGKLMMGPVWDFDMAFGNHLGDIYKYDGWCTTESTYHYINENWMNYLIKYPAFTDAVKARWNEKKDELLKTALDSVEKHSSALDGNQQENFALWNIMTQQIGMGKVPTSYDTYEKQVEYVVEFINGRWEYMDKRINSEF